MKSCKYHLHTECLILTVLGVIVQFRKENKESLKKNINLSSFRADFLAVPPPLEMGLKLTDGMSHSRENPSHLWSAQTRLWYIVRCMKTVHDQWFSVFKAAKCGQKVAITYFSRAMSLILPLVVFFRHNFRLISALGFLRFLLQT